MTAENVVVVFTDMVGSTALASSMSPDAGDVLRRAYFEALRRAIFESGGTEVKHLGDGLMVVFPASSSALSCAVAMQQGIERDNRDRPELIGLRVGISAGDAVFEDDDYFGDAVIEAARLCALCDGGQILATDVVRLMAGRRSAHECRSVGALELKGLPEPVETVEVQWEPLGSEPTPLPLRLASSLSPSFVGRKDERERLRNAWKAVVAGDSRVMLLAGEPGIGKTALAAQFASEAYQGGAIVVYGRSEEDLGVPYQPWIESLTQLVAEASEPVLAAHIADRGGHLARLVPELARRVPLEVPSGAENDAERFVLYGCVIDFLRRISDEMPVLLVLDDLHWADRASLQLLRHVVTSDQPIRVGVLGTFRDSEITAGHLVTELLAALHRDGSSERIALGGLDDDDLLDLMERTAGHGMDDAGVALRDAVLAETAGNPFFVGEILRHLAESGAIYQDDTGRWVSGGDLRAIGLPVSVREVIGRRIAALGSDTARVLALGAVIGRDFDLPLLAAVADIDEDTLLNLCDAAVTAAVLQVTDRVDSYSFAHALIEHTLYDGLSPSRRARAHRAVAEALETTSATDDQRAGELAYHWAQAVQPTDTAKVIHYAKVAGARALDQLAPDDAFRWYAQALDLLDLTSDTDPRQRIEVLIGLGDAERQCGIAAHREHLLDAACLAEEVDAVDLLVRAVLTNSRGYGSNIGHADHDRIGMIRRALDRLPAPASADRAALLAILATELVYEAEFDERLAIARSAVAVARRSGDPVALCRALYSASVSTRAPSMLASCTEWLNEACALADRLDDPIARWETYSERRNWALVEGNLARLRECDVVARTAIEGVPLPALHWTNDILGPCHSIVAGDLVEGERLIEAALQLGLDIGQPDAFTIYAAQLAFVRFHQGRLHEVVPLIEQATADAPAIRAYRPILAMAYARSGELARATQLLDEGLADGFALPLDVSWTTGMASWTEAAAIVEHRDAAPLLHGLLAPYHAQIVTSMISVQPAVAHYLGILDHLLGHYDDAEQWFAEASEIAERMESPLLTAYTNAASAALLADRGEDDERDRTRAMAESALAAACAGGYGYIERDARAVLRRLLK